MRSPNEQRFPRVGDAMTLYAWRRPALWIAATGVPAVAIDAAEALGSLLVFALCWRGDYWLGLLLAVPTMILSTAGLVAARYRMRRTAEVVVPPFWWWAWTHGLAAFGRPLEPIYATMVLWVVVGGTVAIHIVEGLVVHRFGGMSIHAWRPLDSRFALVGASRNTDLVILALSLLFGRPDSGLVLVAWWTLISLIFHSVRFAQLTELQGRRQKVRSWLEQ